MKDLSWEVTRFELDFCRAALAVVGMGGLRKAEEESVGAVQVSYRGGLGM